MKKQGENVVATGVALLISEKEKATEKVKKEHDCSFSWLIRRLVRMYIDDKIKIKV
jgi:hypothetical protein